VKDRISYLDAGPKMPLDKVAQQLRDLNERELLRLDNPAAPFDRAHRVTSLGLKICERLDNNR